MKLELDAEIVEKILKICAEKRDSNDERYNIGYNNALGTIRFTIKEARRQAEDEAFVKENAHPDRNLNLGGCDYVAECDKFMKKEYEVYFDELGNMKVVKLSDDSSCFTDREMKESINKTKEILCLGY